MNQMNLYISPVGIITYRRAIIEQRERAARRLARRATRVVYKRLKLGTWTDIKCKEICRFTLPQIQRICNAAVLTEPFQRFNSLKVETELAMAMLLYRYSSPRRSEDMTDVFGMSLGCNIIMLEEQ